MKMTKAELKFLRNTLIAKRAYRNAEINLGRYKIWEPWMQSTLDRVEAELERSRYHDEHELN